MTSLLCHKKYLQNTWMGMNINNKADQSTVCLWTDLMEKFKLFLF